MQDVDWDAKVYHDQKARLESAFRERNVDAQHVRYVPISSANGDNLLDLSKKSPWYSDKSAPPGEAIFAQSVVEAIDD